MFLPSFGFGITTSFGQIELIDILLVPLLVLFFFAPKTDQPTLSLEIKKLGYFFIGWCVLSVLWINLGYDYREPFPRMVFSGLKVAKFALYSYVGLALCRRMVTPQITEFYNISLLGAGSVLGLSLLAEKLPFVVTFAGDLENAYRVGNMISASLSILLVYIFVLYIRGYGTPLWRKLVIPALVIMAMGSVNTAGRGGWMAAFAGITFAFLFHKKQIRTVLIGIAAIVAVAMIYISNERFQFHVDRTFFPDVKYLEKNKMGVGGVDDGGRVYTWTHELVKIRVSPIFGTGFFHRGDKSGLWPNGSHNFWIQMFLETGVVGGILILMLFGRLWRHSSFIRYKDENISVASKSALVAAFIGGMSGEYFYGSYGLLTLMLIYATIGHNSPVVEVQTSVKTAS